MTLQRVLFLGADPTGGTFAIDRELAMISAELQACGRGLAFEIVSDLKVQPDTLQRLLNQHEPDLLHFSGHVTDGEELMFVDSVEQPRTVAVELFARIVGARQRRVRCVVLSACNGSLAAPALKNQVDTVVAMVGLVSVRAAQVFSRRFYEAIAGEYSVQAAFEQALLEVELVGYQQELHAVLIEREPGVAAQTVFAHGQPRNSHVAKPNPVDVDPTKAPTIFVSYAHEDSDWAKRIRTMMQPLQRTHAVEVWDDRRIQASKDWHAEIDRALSRARIAVLLVSPDFLASEFIEKYELPAILTARQQGRLDILWIYVAPCLVDKSALGSIQAAHSPREPLVTLTGAEQQQHLLQVALKASERLQAS